MLGPLGQGCFSVATRNIEYGSSLLHAAHIAKSLQRRASQEREVLVTSLRCCDPQNPGQLSEAPSEMQSGANADLPKTVPKTTKYATLSAFQIPFGLCLSPRATDTCKYHGVYAYRGA